jgi:hypothetical protein
MITEREVLLDQVLDQIKKDVDAGDYTAIHEMLMELPNETLLAYLPEELQ